jgi:hypothetical protein
VVKRGARLVNDVEVAIRRAWLARRGQPRYRLTGTCNGCGQCCEQPGIQVEKITWHLTSARALFLWWQRVVNGFELVSVEPKYRLFSFRCTHYDPATRQCDSYDSRPYFCRDYPVNLTFDALPEFFPECSHGAVDRKAEQLLAALRDAGVPPEKMEELRKKLYLGDP